MMTKTNSKIAEITLLHVLAMLMILFGHIAQQEKHFVIGEFLISAVPLFLIVSGYMASKNKGTRDGQWLFRKSTRLLTPYYMVTIPAIIIYLLEGLIDTYQIIILGLNMQGLKNYLFYDISFASPVGLGHLWFVTIIFICYLLLHSFDKFHSLRVFRGGVKTLSYSSLL